MPTSNRCTGRFESHDDSNFQKILWRSSPDEPVKIYALNTVTFVNSCAPFLAFRTLHKLAEDEYKTFPTASTILKRDFYVNDLLTGASTFQGAVKIRNDLISLLNKGGFNIRKWAFNDPKLTSHLSEKGCQTTHVSTNFIVIQPIRLTRSSRCASQNYDSTALETATCLGHHRFSRDSKSVD